MEKKIYSIVNTANNETACPVVIATNETAALRQEMLSAKKYKALEITPNPLGIYEDDICDPYRRAEFDVKYGIEDYILVATIDYKGGITNPHWCKVLYRAKDGEAFVWYEGKKLLLGKFIRAEFC